MTAAPNPADHAGTIEDLKAALRHFTEMLDLKGSMIVTLQHRIKFQDQHIDHVSGRLDKLETALEHMAAMKRLASK